MTPDARAAVVIDLLAERGVSLTSQVAAELTATLRTDGSTADVRVQSTCSRAVCIMYTGELPGEEMVAWHAARVKAMSGQTGHVDLRSCMFYQKLHSKTSKTTLERALLDRDPSNGKLADVKELITQHLYAASLPLAATQWQRVLGWAARHFRHDPAKEKVYLWGYFFRTYLGLGLPEERDRDTLIDMSAPTPSGSLSAVEADMRPTIPGELISPVNGVPHLGQITGGLPAGGSGSMSYQGLAELVRTLVSQGLHDQGTPEEGPVIKELPAPKPAEQKCQFCHGMHDLSVKCQAMKQALRLKSAWDKEQANKRKDHEGQPPPPTTPPVGVPP